MEFEAKSPRGAVATLEASDVQRLGRAGMTTSTVRPVQGLIDVFGTAGIRFCGRRHFLGLQSGLASGLFFVRFGLRLRLFDIFGSVAVKFALQSLSGHKELR